MGDHVSFTIHVEAAENVNFKFPDIKDTLTKNIEVLFPIASDTLLEDGRRVVDQTFMITSFEPGIQMIPAQRVEYQVGDIKDTALSMPLLIQVFEPVVDTTQQIKPIKPPINTPLTFREVLPWLAVGLVGLSVIVLAIILINRYWRRRKNPLIFSQKPQEPPHVIAFKELDKLKEEKLWEKGFIKSIRC